MDEHPLAELIRETVATGLSGAYRLAHESVKCVIYFDEGELLFAVSNLRLHRLAECAQRWNFVSAQQLAEVGQQSSDAQLGAALVSAGVLTPEKLAELLSLQAADVLRPALLWVDGTWSFDPRVRLAEATRARIPLGELLMESARRLPAEFVAGRFSNTNETFSLAAEPAIEVELQPIEGFVLSRFDAGGMRLHELLAVSGLPEAESLRAVYALSLGGLLQRELWPRVFTDDLVARFKAARAAAKKAEQEAEAAAPPVLPVPEKIVVPAAPQPPPPPPEVDERQELEQFFARLEMAEDHYEVLGVMRSSDAASIKRIYHALARRFHPDRFHQEAGTELHARLQASFARVAQAYETLRDTRTRAAYDLRMDAQRKMRRPGSFAGAGGGAKQSTYHTRGSQAGSGQAEETFQRGLDALQSGDRALAMSLFGEASRLAPGQANYRAYYGRALSGHKQTRRQAEVELKAAIQLDGNNASYRVMLAELYRELDMKRRAQAEAQRALSLDPQNADAKRLLEELKG
ncbi:MAG: DnaJ domain-containing protein [Acidobacteria bacterium]|nr:DnaJ domain-containing protein [Acidobacteriota bacterium]